MIHIPNQIGLMEALSQSPFGLPHTEKSTDEMIKEIYSFIFSQDAQLPMSQSVEMDYGV